MDRNRLGRSAVAPKRRLLFNAAMQGRRSSQWAPYYLKLRARGLSSTAAFVALSRKLAKVLSGQKVFDVPPLILTISGGHHHTRCFEPPCADHEPFQEGAGRIQVEPDAVPGEVAQDNRCHAAHQLTEGTLGSAAVLNVT